MMKRRMTWQKQSLLIVAAACAVLLLVGGAEAHPMAKGEKAVADDILPVLMSRWHTFNEDVDGDGVSESVLVGGDGLIHVYGSGGDLRWSVASPDILAGTSYELSSTLFFGPFRYQSDPAVTGTLFVDIDGDGAKDIVQTAWFAVTEPENEFVPAVVYISGLDGSVLDLRFHQGLVRNILIDDFDGDGANEFFMVVEDGPRHMNLARTFWIGHGGQLKLVLQEMDGTPIWERPLGLDWAQVSAMEIGTFDGSGNDIALAVTGGFDRYEWLLEARKTHFSQDVYAVDGATGNVLWSTPLSAEYAREMHVGDMDGDLVDDVVVRIQEPAQMEVDRRGDAQGRAVALRGHDGQILWERVNVFGQLPVLHDSMVLDLAEPVLVLAYSEKGAREYREEEVEHLALLSLSNGTVLRDVPLTVGVRNPVYVNSDFGGSSLGPERIGMPAGVSDRPAVRHMLMVTADVGGDGATGLVVGSNRGMLGLRLHGSEVSEVWRSDSPVDREVLLAVSTPSGDELWTQSVQRPRLYAYDAMDGELLREQRLLSLVTGVLRLDLDGDGGLERIIATSGQEVVASNNITGHVLWARDVGGYIFDLLHHDVDGDGTQDVVVIGRHDVTVLDGTDGVVLWHYQHVEQGEFSAWTLDDLDGDGRHELILATRTGSSGASSPAGVAQIMRFTLDDGALQWFNSQPPPAWEIGGLAVGDVDGDGVRDVGFTTQTSTAAVWFGAGVLDGKTGLPLWTIQSPVPTGDNSLDHDGISFADADGDGDLDALVPMQGLQGGLRQIEPRLRALDGRTGIELWTKPIDLGNAQHAMGIWTEPLGVGGADAVLIETDLMGGGWGMALMTPEGEHLWAAHVKEAGFFTDTRVADVTGDGFADVIIGSPHGMLVIDGAATLGGNVTYAGHYLDYAASRLLPVDLDDDPALEVEFFSTYGNWPIMLGTQPYIDMGRGKGVGSLDLTPPDGGDDGDDGGDGGDGGDGAPLPNLPPEARVRVDRSFIFPGDAVTFTSTSKDSDGTIVATDWSFSDGVVGNTTEVVRSFPVPGSYSVRLTVTDDDNATDSILHTFNVAPPENFGIRQDRDGSLASPGETVQYAVQVINSGRDTANFTISLAGPEGWGLALDGPATVDVASMGSHTWRVAYTVGEAAPKSELTATVTGASGKSETLTHRVMVPIVLDAALDESDKEYLPLQDVGGTLRLTWLDGTPLVGVEVRVDVSGSDTVHMVQTGDDGRASFTVPKDDPVWRPGSYTARLAVDHLEYTNYRHLAFQVTATG